MPMIILVWATACGGAERPEPNRVYRAIQVHEATIAHAMGDAARCPSEAECPAASQVCEAAEALCAEARALPEDADAYMRCEDGQRQCRRVRR